MSSSMQVLAVPHQLQGTRFSGYVKDSSYESLIQDLVCQVDFVFEEASGRGPSVAEGLVREVLGSGHYLDVDPLSSEREHYGIAKRTGGDCLIDPYQLFSKDSPDSYRCESVEEHRKREEIWLQRILDQGFEKGLMVCGSAHGLSFALRLQPAGFSEVQLYHYIPYNKLCTRPHKDQVNPDR